MADFFPEGEEEEEEEEPRYPSEGWVRDEENLDELCERSDEVGEEARGRRAAAAAQFCPLGDEEEDEDGQPSYPSEGWK